MNKINVQPTLSTRILNTVAQSFDDYPWQTILFFAGAGFMLGAIIGGAVALVF